MRTFSYLACIVGSALAIAGCSAGLTAVTRNDPAQLRAALNAPNRNENLAHLMFSALEDGKIDCVRELLDAPGASTDTSSWSGIEFTDMGTWISLAQGSDGDRFRHADIAQLLIAHAHGAKAKQMVVHNGKASFSDKTADDEEVPAAPAAPVHSGKAGKRPHAPVVEDSSDEPVAAPVAAPVARLLPLFQSEEHPNDYALIVGVEKYADLPAATYAESDAKAMGDFVRAMGVPARNIETLTGIRATRSGLLKNLETWLANNVNENSTVYFYYSGHGAPDPATGLAYLVPLDGDPQYLADTGYPLKRLYEKLGKLKAKRVIVMLDSCFSGAGGRSVLAKGARPLVNSVDTGYDSDGGKIEVLSASASDQISGTDDASGHGLFTYQLLTGLNGAAEDAQGRVTMKSLFAYLKPKVMDEAHRANREQTPQLQAGGGDGADVVLRRK